MRSNSDIVQIEKNIVQLYNFRICANLQEVGLLTFWVDKAHVKNHKIYHLYTYEKYCTSPHSPVKRVKVVKVRHLLLCEPFAWR